MNSMLDDLTEDYARQYAKRGEDIITAMLVRHYGSKLWASAEDALEMLSDDGLVLFRCVHPYPRDPELILMRGPATKLGEKMDESRIIDRVEHPPIFAHAITWPGVETYQA